jgi:hypothetical protein
MLPVGFEPTISAGVIFAEVFVDAVVVVPLASFQVHLQCLLPPLLAHFLTLYELAYPVKQK